MWTSVLKRNTYIQLFLKVVHLHLEILSLKTKIAYVCCETIYKSNTVPPFSLRRDGAFQMMTHIFRRVRSSGHFDRSLRLEKETRVFILV